MRIKGWFAIAAIAAASIGGGVWAVRSAAPNTASGEVHVALVGASIGQDWNLATWPARANAASFSAESFAVWEFDKSSAVDELLLRPKRRFRFTRTYLKSLLAPPPRKPDVVILKECSSYFPGNLEAQRTAFRGWAERLSGAGTRVVLATVVPVTSTRAQADAGKQAALTEFNAWVREYAASKQLPVLDLDAAMRSGAPGSNLRDEYTSGDGSHLNRAAYTVLDRALLDTLCNLKSDAACGRGGAT
jgi:hypothetical protein